MARWPSSLRGQPWRRFAKCAKCQWVILLKLAPIASGQMFKFTKDNMSYTHGISIGFFAFFLTSTCFAAENTIPAITATPNKTICAPSKFSLNEAPVNGELCVTQGSFSADKYTLKFDGKKVLEGIDDQTTLGISSKYGEKSISLKCTPQLIKGNATPDDVRKIVPTYSDSKVKEMVELMAGSSLPVEVGRLCAIRSTEELLMKVQVFFE